MRAWGCIETGRMGTVTVSDMGLGTFCRQAPHRQLGVDSTAVHNVAKEIFTTLAPVEEWMLDHRLATLLTRLDLFVVPFEAQWRSIQAVTR